MKPIASGVKAFDKFENFSHRDRDITKFVLREVKGEIR